MDIGTIFLSIPLVGMEDLEAFHEFAELVGSLFFCCEQLRSAKRDQCCARISLVKGNAFGLKPLEGT